MSSISLQFPDGPAPSNLQIEVRAASSPQEASLKPAAVVEKLTGLRTELIDLAYVLERRGRPEAADVAMTISARLQEICDELILPPPAGIHPLVARVDQ